MDFSGFWFLVGEDRADVGPFVVDVDILDFDAVLRNSCVFQQGDARIQRPLLIAREQNGGAIEPRHSGHFAVNIAPEREKAKKGSTSEIYGDLHSNTAFTQMPLENEKTCFKVEVQMWCWLHVNKFQLWRCRFNRLIQCNMSIFHIKNLLK